MNNKIMSTLSRHGSPSANYTEVRNSALNKSTSKMQYSFSKSNRFSSQTRLMTDPPYYDIPKINHQRSTTFGIGSKLTFEDRRAVPASNTYTLEDEFSKQKAQKRGFSFGIGDKKTSSCFFKKSDLPGPGAYNPEQRLNTLSSLILGRLKDHTLDEKIKVPGPGQYDQPILSREGKAISSRHSNPRLPVILKEQRGKVRRSENPAPWAYDPMVTPKGNHMSSRKTTKFSSSKKMAIYRINDHPGPGFYNLFSEFPS